MAFLRIAVQVTHLQCAKMPWQSFRTLRYFAMAFLRIAGVLLVLPSGKKFILVFSSLFLSFQFCVTYVSLFH
jgi:hypothetical protein